MTDHAKTFRPSFKGSLEIFLPVFVTYLVAAYFLLPSIWRHYEHQKKLDGLPMVTATGSGIPADPINIALIGSKKDILCAMHGAGWFPADPITLHSSLEISRSVIFHRPYPTAPVSDLFYAGRKQDLAFEKPVGNSADQRNHMRIWKVLDQGEEKRPVWLGAATFDRRVGLGHFTGEITHHIAADVDAERSEVEADLQTAGLIEARYEVMGLGPTLRARNGEGDPYFTDGEVWVLRLVEDCVRRALPPDRLASPPVTALKDVIWRNIASLFRTSER